MFSKHFVAGLSLVEIINPHRAFSFDLLIFRNIDKLSKRLNPISLIVFEVVFGVLLTALAVELVVSGLASLGIIEPVHHH